MLSSVGRGAGSIIKPTDLVKLELTTMPLLGICSTTELSVPIGYLGMKILYQKNGQEFVNFQEYNVYKNGPDNKKKKTTVQSQINEHTKRWRPLVSEHLFHIPAVF